jgi:serine/threonine-protein kinase
MLKTGTVLSDRYEILSQLGTGGMGEVYRAKDLRLNREVAIKVLPDDLAANPTALSRFEREAKALAALSHGNILTIFDFGTHNGISFAVMELLKGQTLRSSLNVSKLHWEKSVKIATAVADGLVAAHSAGVIHRDLKPENIFISTEGVVKILDFGLARLETPVKLNNQKSIETISQDGIIVGTVPYMSPEQIRGENIDARTDIFSFGCVFYEMLTGNRAFEKENPADTFLAILSQNPPRPVEINDQIPASLDQIVEHCLEKKPDQRFQTARDLTFALASAMRDEPSKISKTVKDRKFSKLTIPLSVLFIGMVAALSYLFVGRSEPVRSIAILPFANVSGNVDTEYLSDGISESIITNVSQIPNLKVLARDTVHRYKGKEIDSRKIGKDLNVDAIVTGRVLQHGNTLTIYAHLVNTSDGSVMWGQQYNQEIKNVVQVQEEISTAISTNLRLKLDKKVIAKHHTDNPEAYQLYLKARYHFFRFTPEDYEKSLENFKQAIEMDPFYTLAYSGMALLYVSMTFEGFLHPKEGCGKARWAVRKALEIDTNLAEAHSAAASTSNCELKTSESIQEYRRAIQLNPNLIDARKFYSQILRNVGRFEEAIDEAKKVQELDPLSAQSIYSLGIMYYWAGKDDEAIVQYKKSLDLDANFAKAYDGLADVYERKGMFAEAITNSNTYLRLVRDEEGAEMLLENFESYGFEKAKQLQYERELGFYTEAAKEQYIPAIAFAAIYAQLNQKDQAFLWLEKAFEERHPWLVNVHTDPQFESLRSDPRFNNLMERIGL